MLLGKKPRALCPYFLDLDECTTGPILVTSIPFARIPWVLTNARVMLSTQEMENLAMVFEIQLILHVRP